MSTPFEFYLRGSSTYFATTGTTVPTGGADAAPTTIKAPAGAAEWVTVEAYGADPTLINEGEAWTTPAGSEYKDSEPRWTFTIKTRRYGFPADFSAYKTLLQHLSRRYLYLAVKTYDVALHGANTCIPVTVESSVEHDYSYGKSITITLRHRKQTETL